MNTDLLFTQLTTVGVSLFFLILIRIEVKRLKNMLTPFVFSAAPFIAIFLVTNFLLVSFDFPLVSIRSQLFIALCLLITYGVGHIISTFYKQKELASGNFLKGFTEEFSPFVPFLILASWAVIFLVLNKSLSLMRQHGGFAFFGDQEYENKMLVGYVAHLVQLGKVLFLFLMFTISKSRFKKISFLTLLFLGLAIASIQVKYHFIHIVVISLLFYNFSKPVKKQLKFLAVFTLLLFLLMNIFWITLTFAWGTFGFSKIGIWEFLLKQTLNYFVTGPILLDKWLLHPAVRPDWTLLLVFLNLANFITGSTAFYNNVHLVSLGFQQTSPGLYSNVGTAYGVYYIVGGIPFTVFMVILVSIISYLLYFSLLRSSNPILIFFTLLFITLNLLNFFVQYFTIFSFYEMSVIFIILVILLKLYNKSRQLIYWKSKS